MLRTPQALPKIASLKVSITMPSPVKGTLELADDLVSLARRNAPAGTSPKTYQNPPQGPRHHARLRRGEHALRRLAEDLSQRLAEDAERRVDLCLGDHQRRQEAHCLSCTCSACSLHVCQDPQAFQESLRHAGKYGDAVLMISGGGGGALTRGVCTLGGACHDMPLRVVHESN